jgi:hypothetical protein
LLQFFDHEFDYRFVIPYVDSGQVKNRDSEVIADGVDNQSLHLLGQIRHDVEEIDLVIFTDFWSQILVI